MKATQEDVAGMPTDETEFKLNWTHCSGIVSGLKQAHGLALADAGYYFAQGSDANATLMRDFARRIAETMVPHEIRLKRYIAEDEGRRRAVK